jgi:hypothetical protein
MKGLLEPGGLLRPTKTWTSKAKTRRRCPPVEDCAAQNALPARPTAKQRREAAKIAAAQKAAREAAKKQRKAAKNPPAPEPQKPGWPFSGSYDPRKSRGR